MAVPMIIVGIVNSDHVVHVCSIPRTFQFIRRIGRRPELGFVTSKPELIAEAVARYRNGRM